MTADDLRDMLTALELTQNDAARLLGVHERSMRHWCMGDRPVPETVRRLLALLKCQDRNLRGVRAALEAMHKEAA